MSIRIEEGTGTLHSSNPCLPPFPRFLHSIPILLIHKNQNYAPTHKTPTTTQTFTHTLPLKKVDKLNGHTISTNGNNKRDRAPNGGRPDNKNDKKRKGIETMIRKNAGESGSVSDEYEDPQDEMDFDDSPAYYEGGAGPSRPAYPGRGDSYTDDFGVGSSHGGTGGGGGRKGFKGQHHNEDKIVDQDFFNRFDDDFDDTELL
ncbi:hypothetical protein HDV00_003421 [Rhizophlyctis rosea]|nr:hypothetical protein HDV00_003421 [Rhizophlyctis rosea]